VVTTLVQKGRDSSLFGPFYVKYLSYVTIPIKPSVFK
jgi:hypothetical protein